MSRSLNETQSLIKAAARGAGLSWGEALDYALGMRWMAVQGINSWTACADHLEQVAADAVTAPDGFGPILRGNAPLCPLRSGLLLSDHRFALTDDTTITLQNLAFPALILPFLALSGQQIRLSGPDFSVIVGQEGWSGTLPPNASGDARLHPEKLIDPAQKRQTRVSMTDEDHGRLLALAAKTYAPATEASRLAGAGAGLSDND